MSRAPAWLVAASLEDIEHRIANLPSPTFVRLKRNSSANLNARNLPLFSVAWDELCSLIGTFPSQEMYGGFYLHKFKDSDMLSRIAPLDIYQRARRNHPSFVREYHAYALLRKYLPSEFKINYEYETDRIGLDYIIEYDKKCVGIKSYIGTSNSLYMASHKAKYRQPKHDIMVIDMVADSTKNINGYWLYSDDVVKSVVEQVASHLLFDNYTIDRGG